MQPAKALPMIEPKATESAGNQAMKIGVMGSAGEFIPDGHLSLAEQLGEAIARSGCVLITGGCPGLVASVTWLSQYSPPATSRQEPASSTMEIHTR